MATGDILAYFANKKLLPLEMVEEYIFDYLKKVAEDGLEKQYRLDGVFDAEATVTTSGTGVVTIAGAFTATDGDGKIFDFGAADPLLDDVPFENNNGVTYHMGLRSILLPEELDINPRTGQPEYRTRVENIGAIADPDLVTDNGSTITLLVDDVCDGGFNYGGRTVRVWLVTPKAITWASAYEDVVISWTEPTGNEITTTGLLGQTAGSVSEVEAEYQVALLGPTIKRQVTEDLIAAADTCFIAKFDGAAGAPAPDMTDQRIFTGSLSDLADITRTDSHGDLKVSVRADASDSGEDQIRVENSSGTKVFGVDETGGFELLNSSGAMPIDDAGTYGAAGGIFNGDSIMGYLNQGIIVDDGLVGPTIFDGMGVSGGSGGNINFDGGSGFAVAPGTGGFVDVSGGSLAVGDGTWYIYVDPTTSLHVATATKSVAFGDSKLPIALVTMSGGSMTANTDLRCLSTKTDKRGVYTVGEGDKASNFDSILAAIDYLAAYQDQSSERYPGATLRIVGDLDVGANAVTIPAELDGLIIEGVGWKGDSDRAIVRYDASVMGTDNACFILEADDVLFRGIQFVTVDGPGPGTDTACVRQDTGGGALLGTTFEGCKFTSTDDTLAFAVRGHSNVNWDNVSFIDCVFDLANSSPTYCALCDYGGNNWTMSRCVFNGDNGSTMIVANDDGLTDFYANGCQFNTMLGVGIADGGSVHKVQARFVGCTGELGEVINAAMVSCSFTATQFLPSGSSEVIDVSACEITGVNLINKGNASSLIRCSDSVLTPEVGSSYFIGGSNPDNIEVRNCRIVPTVSVTSSAHVMTLDNNCRLINNVIGPMRTATKNDYRFINVTGINVVIEGNELDGSYYTAVIYAGIGCDILNNRITNPTEGSSETAIGIHVANISGCRIMNNVISVIGGATYGGVGILITGASVLSGQIIGNEINQVEGPALHGSPNNFTITGNGLRGGLVTITNIATGAVELHAVKLTGAGCVIVGNRVVAEEATGVGISIESSGNRHVINSNYCTGGTDGVYLQTGSQQCLVDANMLPTGLTDSGATNTVANNVLV